MKMYFNSMHPPWTKMLHSKLCHLHNKVYVSLSSIFSFLPHNCNGINNIKVVSCIVTLANSIITFFWNLKGWTIIYACQQPARELKQRTIYNCKFEIFCLFLFLFTKKTKRVSSCTFS